MTKTIKINGMSCMHCSKAVKDELNALEGVSSTVDLDNGLATVEITNDAITDADLRVAVEEAGYEVIEIK